MATKMKVMFQQKLWLKWLLTTSPVCFTDIYKKTDSGAVSQVTNTSLSAFADSNCKEATEQLSGSGDMEIPPNLCWNC